MEVNHGNRIPAISVLLVDDHYIVRAGIRDLLVNSVEKVEPIYLDENGVGEAGTGKEALMAIHERPWSLVLLDFNLPDMNGIDLIKLIKAKKPKLPILMFSSFAESEYAIACLKAGAAGYVNKDANPEEIRRAIRIVAGGEDYIGPGLRQQLLLGIRPQMCEPHERLTCRENEVMLGISRGQSLTRIADNLMLSVKTISTHRTKLLEKMGMKNNAEITKYVHDRRLDQGIR